MRNKIVTLLGSILKPVDDTRMFEKLAVSLHQSGKYEVNIIGFQTKNPPNHPQIRLYEAFRFKRLSIRRFFSPVKFFWYALRIKPQLLIVTTHELLLSALLYKLIMGDVFLVYDLQENYYRNMLHQGGLPKPLRFTIAQVIRLKEKLATRWIDRFWLAEEKYAEELTFCQGNADIILNKFRHSYQSKIPDMKPLSNTRDQILKFVYSGTIHEVYGIWEAIELIKKLRAKMHVSLLVIGCAKIPRTYHTLLQMEKEYDWLTLNISPDPIPHNAILQAIEQADWGMVSHRPVPSISNCFPTRIYELMALKKPFLLENHHLWTSYCQPWKCAVEVDFVSPDIEDIMRKIKSNTFYPKGIPDTIYWDSEEIKLLNSLDALLKNKRKVL